MGVRKGERCHYQCGRLADTVDHIVARCHIQRPSAAPMTTHQANLVPSCYACNYYKGYYRSDCNCIICLTAWELMADFILPKRKRDIPLRAVVGVLTSLDIGDEETG
jgi:hypothetical protein